MSIHEKPDGTIYVSWRDEYGKQHTKPFGKGDIAKAQAKEHDAKLKLDKKLGKSMVPAGNLELMYLDVLAQKYIDYCRSEGKRTEWLKDLKNLLNNHWILKLVHKPVDQLTQGDMENFINV